MKYIFCSALILLSCICRSQLTVNILVPPSGIMDKQQLWNMVLTNTEAGSITVRAHISFSELGTGQPVFTASTGNITVNTGTKQLSANAIGPIQYITLNNNYRIDPGPTGLLPVGTFMVCYDIMLIKYNKVIQDCQQVTIPPLGPLLLSQPSNGTVLQEFHPTFSWLPPSPVQSLTNLRYDLKLVEILPNQSAADAIQSNLPVFITRNVASSNYPYLQSAPSLQPDKTYAWQVTAKNNLSEIAKSETWSFTTKQEKGAPNVPKPDPSYIKLKKAGGQEGYAVFWSNLRIDYLNETTDTTWHMQVEDLSAAQHVSFVIDPGKTKLGRGQNLLNYEASADSRFIDKHLYLLQVTNSKNEVWQLRFEYRK